MAASNNHGFSWHHTMLRIKDPKATLPFYTEHFGFSLIHQYHFAQWNFSLYFLAILPEGTTFPEPGTKEAEQFLWTFKGTCLELTHNHGAENDADFKVSSGNTEPNRGFGHIAVMTPDVYAVSAELEAKGVAFQKRPDEGRMKGLAFALDPDGYWIEIVKRNEQAQIANKYTLAQTMFRIKDPVKSLHFYRDLLGMTLLRESHHGDFSLYFLAHLRPEEAGQADSENFVSRRFGPVIELTHNHGTENDADFRYYNGNDQDKEGQVRGFGHTAFLADDLDAACAYLESEGVSFKKKPMDGNMRGIAFVYDPDNYWVEVIQRGGVSML